MLILHKPAGRIKHFNITQGNRTIKAQWNTAAETTDHDSQTLLFHVALAAGQRR